MIKELEKLASSLASVAQAIKWAQGPAHRQMVAEANKAPVGPKPGYPSGYGAAEAKAFPSSHPGMGGGTQQAQQGAPPAMTPAQRSLGPDYQSTWQRRNPGEAMPAGAPPSQGRLAGPGGQQFNSEWAGGQSLDPRNTARGYHQRLPGAEHGGVNLGGDSTDAHSPRARSIQRLMMDKHIEQRRLAQQQQQQTGYPQRGPELPDPHGFGQQYRDRANRQLR